MTMTDQGGALAWLRERPALLRPSECADMFGVAAKTVAKWADEGKLECVRGTAGADRRYFLAQVVTLLSPTDENRAEWERLQLALGLIHTN
jgi:phage terminase Nu1 subunit (DNA packaging protein)